MISETKLKLQAIMTWIRIPSTSGCRLKSDIMDNNSFCVILGGRRKTLEDIPGDEECLVIWV